MRSIEDVLTLMILPYSLQTGDKIVSIRKVCKSLEPTSPVYVYFIPNHYQEPMVDEK